MHARQASECVVRYVIRPTRTCSNTNDDVSGNDTAEVDVAAGDDDDNDKRHLLCISFPMWGHHMRSPLLGLFI